MLTVIHCVLFLITVVQLNFSYSKVDIKIIDTTEATVQEAHACESCKFSITHSRQCFPTKAMLCWPFHLKQSQEVLS